MLFDFTWGVVSIIVMNFNLILNLLSEGWFSHKTGTQKYRILTKTYWLSGLYKIL